MPDTLIAHTEAKYDNLSPEFLASCVRRLNMPTDIERFQNDLLESVRQMRTSKAGRTTEVKLSAAAEACASTGLSQADGSGPHSAASCSQASEGSLEPSRVTSNDSAGG
jgi:hypothetical protein